MWTLKYLMSAVRDWNQTADYNCFFGLKTSRPTVTLKINTHSNVIRRRPAWRTSTKDEIWCSNQCYINKVLSNMHLTGVKMNKFTSTISVQIPCLTWHSIGIYWCICTSHRRKRLMSNHLSRTRNFFKDNQFTKKEREDWMLVPSAPTHLDSEQLDNPT